MYIDVSDVDLWWWGGGEGVGEILIFLKRGGFGCVLVVYVVFNGV